MIYIIYNRFKNLLFGFIDLIIKYTNSIDIPILIYDLGHYLPLLFLVIIFGFILLIAYIKIKYPFWNIQPVYHTYDIFRKYYSNPFIIREKPDITKFCDFLQVKTISYYDLTKNNKTEIIDVLRCNYIPSDKIVFTIDLEILDLLFNGYTNVPYISVYLEKEYVIKSDKTPDINNINTSSALEIKNSTIPLGLITSRPFHIHFSNKIQPFYIQAYFIDFVCIKRDHSDTINISRKLFQTHEYNQRAKNPSISISFFKKEEENAINLCEGIVPLVKYNTYTVEMPSLRLLKHIIKKTVLPRHVQIIRIYRDNLDILTDILGTNLLKEFNICIFSDLAVLIEQIKRELFYVYIIKNKTDILAYYFVKNATTHFEQLENSGDATLSLVASFCNMNSAVLANQELFFKGFVFLLKEIQQMKHKTKYNMLFMDAISHNNMILEYYTEMTRSLNTKITLKKHVNAYYLYNYVIPWQPISNPMKCFILI